MRARRARTLSLEQRLALKFTWLVCGLILLSGTVFAASDVVIGNYRMMQGLNDQIDRMLATSAVTTDPANAGQLLPYAVRPFVRILAPDGTVLYKGDLFAASKPGPVDPFATNKPGDESYAIATRTLKRDGRIVGYLQLAGRTRQGIRDVGFKLVEVLLITVLMGIITYFLGLAFSRQTLRPVHESQERLEQFTQDASHELRTPLAAISSSLDVALKTGEYEEGISAAKGQVKYASLLVERLLEVARLDRTRVDLELVDLTSLVAAVASQQAEQCREHGLALTSSLADGATVEGDAVLVRQLVNNLVENAVKFNAPGGTVDVVLTADLLRVVNSGGVIAPEDLPHVFEPFYQADGSRSGRGFGLGLAIVKKIATLHGWRIDVASTPEQGTTFVVAFGAAARRRSS
ncbi:MAG TPA: HAMP domain-containing sensor histidine kinase [Candidatus Cryosericum sp.]|nr:HAMP domain-containing sensor histidine kinase [Candidatus Cryosericum sp.]